MASYFLQGVTGHLQAMNIMDYHHGWITAENFYLGQHNFEFRSVSIFHGKCGGAGLISSLHFTTNFAYFVEGTSVEKS